MHAVGCSRSFFVLGSEHVSFQHPCFFDVFHPCMRPSIELHEVSKEDLQGLFIGGVLGLQELHDHGLVPLRVREDFLVVGHGSNVADILQSRRQDRRHRAPEQRAR
eukprot:scaffold1671_cov344-Pavlova_lutheri.AAC.34